MYSTQERNKDINRICFFCNQEILEKKTLEHIIPNSLLRKLGIKNQPLETKSVDIIGSNTYSRIKVPAHEKCNSGFASRYESKILNLLDDPLQLYEDLVQEEEGIPIRYGPATDKTTLFSTWLSKIYYGLFYHDSLKSKNTAWRNTATDVVNCLNFGLIQESYKYGHGFFVPSSLFVFKSSKDNSFDLRTLIYPETILIKIFNITFILCIGDGFLVKNYLNHGYLDGLREHVYKLENEQENCPAYLLAWAEVLALRDCIPKNPYFLVAEHDIINMSLSTCAANPQQAYALDQNRLSEARNFYLQQL